MPKVAAIVGDAMPKAQPSVHGGDDGDIAELGEDVSAADIDGSNGDVCCIKGAGRGRNVDDSIVEWGEHVTLAAELPSVTSAVAFATLAGSA